MIKFKYYKSGTTFAAATDIAADDIVFIEDGNKLHTHDHDFVFGNAYADIIAGKQTQVAKLGSTTKPVYTSAAGTFAECSTYAGGTAVTLNGSSKAASTASFYAPTAAGTSGQYLKSNGSGAPTWATFPTIPSVPSGFNSSTTIVNSIGGKSGAVTLKGDNTSNGTINLSIDSSNQVSASIIGLGSAAFTASSAYATAAQGTLASNAMPKSGGTFTGAITLSGAPTSDLHAATKKYVDDNIISKISAADAMVFKGTLGTGGTVTAVPTTNVTKGDTYKVITAGSWAGSTTKVGDLLIAMTSGASVTANTTNWVHVPSGDETVTTIATSSSPNVGSTAKSGTVTLGTVVTKGVETSLTDSSANVPTSSAVKAFVEGKGYTTTNGTVRSVALSVPTGLSVTGSPITTTGTLTMSFASGYSIPTTAKQTNWDNAYNALTWSEYN